MELSHKSVAILLYESPAEVASLPCPPSVFLWSSCFTAEIECCLLSVSQVESPDSMGSVTIITVNCTRNCRREKRSRCCLRPLL